MKKNTFYFSHDYNSRTDEKIKNLIRKHGMAGYGIFWSIVEDLYNNTNVLRTDYDGIAYELRTNTEMVQSVIQDFDLFVIDGDSFGSISVEERLNERAEKSKEAVKSVTARWTKYHEKYERIEKPNERTTTVLNNDTNVTLLDTNVTLLDTNVILERKGKERTQKTESKEEKSTKKEEVVTDQAFLNISSNPFLKTDAYTKTETQFDSLFGSN